MKTNLVLVVANSVTLFFGTLLIKLSLKSVRLLKPDRWTERNTNSRGQNIQPGTALRLDKGSKLVLNK